MKNISRAQHLLTIPATASLRQHQWLPFSKKPFATAVELALHGCAISVDSLVLVGLFTIGVQSPHYTPHCSETYLVNRTVFVESFD